MKFAVVGAGAIGSYLGAKLSLAGQEVHLIARGPHLRAMQEHGVRVRGHDADFQVSIPATEDFNLVGPVDFVFLTVKAHSLTEVAQKLTPLLGPETVVVSAQNGMPWWYFQHHGGSWDGSCLESVDPEGVITRAVETHRIIGCVIYISAVIAEPGVIEYVEGNRLAIGELDGSQSERCKRLSKVLANAGFKSPVRSNIRHDIWVKLLGNVVFNPISAVTGATLVEIATHPEAKTLVREVMEETDSVAKALGVEIAITIDQRIRGAQNVGHHKTSMLQDVEAGKPIELESVVGAVVELGDKLSIPVPHTRALYACAKLLAQKLG